MDTTTHQGDGAPEGMGLAEMLQANAGPRSGGAPEDVSDDTPLTEAEIATNEETERHIRTVRVLLHHFSERLYDRARVHDASKKERPEVAIFAEYTSKLRGMTYGSDEYKACLAAMKPALDHHYAHNSHHPEHHADGVAGMDLLDLVEMFADWKAATLRHADGDLARSVEINTERFGLSPQLASIFRNSLGLFDAARFPAGTDGPEAVRTAADWAVEKRQAWRTRPEDEAEVEAISGLLVTERGYADLVQRLGRSGKIRLHQEPICWNPWNKVVQDHRTGDVDQAGTDRERAKRGLPVPWTPEMAGREVHEPPIY